MLCRKRHIDDRLEATDACTAVVLGAGFDTRCCGHWDGRVFEVDLPIAAKTEHERLLALFGALLSGSTLVPVDLDLIKDLGADHVVDVRQVNEWVPEARYPPSEDEFTDLEWTVVERAVTQDEIHSTPLACGDQVLAVVRHGQRFWAEDPAVAVLRGDDRVLVVRSGPVCG